MHNGNTALWIVALYLGAATCIGSLALSPGLRERLLGWVRRNLDQTRQGLMRLGGGAGVAMRGTGDAVGGRWSRLLASLCANRLLVAAALCVLLVPLVLVLLVHRQFDPTAYDDAADPHNAVVAQLLRGEQLVPPPPLPPEVFLTQEVQAERPLIVSASRDWQQLDTDFRQRLLLVFQLMEQRYGYKMALIEGYRSPERQNKLAAMGGSVTNAAAFQSYHQYGLASDCAFLRDGKLVISERDPWAMRGYQLYGEVAESLGLTWGGRWKMMDLGHVELHRKGVLGGAPTNVAPPK